MADNVAITAGSGTDIATDQVTGTNEHVQIVKLAVSADGSRSLVPADPTYGLDVEITRIVPATEFKCAQYTTTQSAGTILWQPQSGKSVVITALQIQVGGTTAGTTQIWFGGSADTSYTRGTDPVLFDGEWVPTATNKPGLYTTYFTPIRAPVDHRLRVTTGAAITITINVWGYEV